MALENFFDHKCSLYHVVGSEESPGYGLPDSPSFDYPTEPDEANIPCHFAQGSSGGTLNTLVQNLPEHAYQERIKLTLPIGTDIRVNDKVLDHRTNLVYIAEIPRNIRNHHIYVWVKREGTEVGL